MRFVIVAALLGLGVSGATQAQLVREANTTLKMPAALAPGNYTSDPAFANVTFTNPVAITTPRGETNRLFVVEQRGRIAVITNLAAPDRTLYLDIASRIAGGNPTDERGLLGLAFHPGYATNRYFYVFYSVNTTTAAGTGLHQRISRFEGSPDNPNAALAASETPLITQRDLADNHNGGDLHFGPDGYLYVSLGDGGGGNDNLNNSQRIDKDFHSAILRIDVDQRPGNIAPNPHPAVHPGTFAVPADNPFLGATSFLGRAVSPTAVRTEFWAVGLRNPWRMSFDPASGTLYCGDVGQGAREEVDIIVRGGNYGWAYREGNLNGPKSGQAPAGFTYLPPIQDYGRGSATNQGASVTGGVVYRGNQIADLFGWYVFSDYVSGNVWALRYDGTNSRPFRFLFRNNGVAGFGYDPRNGDVLLADQSRDMLRRLVYNTNVVTGPQLPATLAETGAFSDLLTLTPERGIVPYDLNVPFWSDGARKRRWFSVPELTQKIGFSVTNNWSFPTGTVWVKHFEIELTNGVPESTRWLETRFIVRTSNGVYGATYRWDESLTNATLVPEGGLDEPIVVHDAGMVRTQIWHYPSRAECLACHTPAGGWALGFNTAQLNREVGLHGDVTNQVAALAAAGYLAESPPFIYPLPALAPAADEAASDEHRVRSYLTANCSQCHQPGGTAIGLFDTRFHTPTEHAGLIEGRLLNYSENPESRVIKPGSLELSMLLRRINTLGPGRMPPLASSVVDTQAVTLVSTWITNALPADQTFMAWQTAHFGSTNAPNAGTESDADNDGAVNYLEYLTGGNPLEPADPWKIQVTLTNQTVEIVFPQMANRAFEVQVTTNLLTGNWQPLDVPSNRPLFAATNRVGVVTDTLAEGNERYYRVRVFEK